MVTALTGIKPTSWKESAKAEPAAVGRCRTRESDKRVVAHGQVEIWRARPVMSLIGSAINYLLVVTHDQRQVTVRSVQGAILSLHCMTAASMDATLTAYFLDRSRP